MTIGEEEQIVQAETEAVPVYEADDIFDDHIEAMGESENVEILYDNEELNGEVAELDTEENRECLERVKRGVQNFHNLYWTLAQDVHKVSTNRLYRLAGYKKFDDYVQSELGFSKRKAHYLVSTFAYFNEDVKAKLADKPDLYNSIIEKVKQLGWTKAEKIASKNVLTSENAEQLFEKFTAINEKGKLPSVPEIEDMVAKEYNAKDEIEKEEADEGNNVETASMRFTFSKAQANTVNEALDIAKGMCQPGAKSSTQIAWVCADFVTSYSSDRGKEIDVATTMARFEELLGVDIVVLDRMTGEVKYGQESATALKNTPN